MGNFKKRTRTEPFKVTPSTAAIIKDCLKLEGGRSRPDKSAPAILKFLNGKQGTILDVGCGQGSFGRIIHEQHPNRFQIHGVEAHGRHQAAASKTLKYAKIWREDYTYTYWKRTGYDFYLLVDILEHFHVKTAVKIVKRLRKDGVIIASIPNGPKHWHQDPEFERLNPLERHLYNWTDEQVSDLLGLHLIHSEGDIGVYVSER